MMNANLWGVFHDGDIVSVSGNVPGDIDVSIELEYIRKRFPDPGKGFRIHLTSCDLLSFKSFKTNETRSGVEALAGQDLEILSAKLDGDVLQVVTCGGVLRMRYLTEGLSLDSGRSVHFSDIVEAANYAFGEQKPPKN